MEDAVDKKVQEVTEKTFSEKNSRQVSNTFEVICSFERIVTSH